MISKKRENFCREYLKDFNVKQAANRTGYSNKVGNTVGYRNLLNPGVAKFLKKLKSEHIEKAQLTIEAVVTEIKSIAYAIADGEMIKTADKIKALELLGRNLGIFSDKDIPSQNAEINVHVVIVDKVEEEKK